MRPSGNRATISGTLVAADASKGGGSPLANVTVSVTGSGQTAQTDASGSFTLTDVPAGVVGLDIRGAGLHTSATVSAPAGLVTKVTVTVSKEHSTVSLKPRSDGTEGTVDSMPSATSFVLKNSRGMVTVQTDANTKFRMHGSAASFGDLKVGQHVEVEGSPQPDGSILASQVNIEDPEQDEATRTPTPTGTITPPPTRTPRPNKVELEGTIGPISAPNFTLMTRSGPVTIQTDSATRFQREDGSATFADLKTGDKVEVEGARQSDGSVLATRVNSENDGEEERTKTPTPAMSTTPMPSSTPKPTRTPEVEGADENGTVGPITGTSFVLMTEDHGSVMVQTNAATQFSKDGSPASFSDITTGGEAEVKGTFQMDGSLLASRISIKGHS